MNAEQAYHDHKRLLHERAWHWARSTGRDVADCLGECHAAFMECVRLWEPGRGARFSSLLATMCNQQLGRYCQQHDFPAEFDPDAVVGHVADPVQEVAWRELRDSLSAEARALVDTILGSAGELFTLIRPCDHTGQALRNAAERLLWRHGWTRARLRPLFAEIAAAVEEAR